MRTGGQPVIQVAPPHRAPGSPATVACSRQASAGSRREARTTAPPRAPPPRWPGLTPILPDLAAPPSFTASVSACRSRLQARPPARSLKQVRARWRPAATAGLNLAFRSPDGLSETAQGAPGDGAPSARRRQQRRCLPAMQRAFLIVQAPSDVPAAAHVLSCPAACLGSASPGPQRRWPLAQALARLGRRHAAAASGRSIKPAPAAAAHAPERSPSPPVRLPPQPCRPRRRRR